MKVLVLAGSPHAKGTTALLADAFLEGAIEAGHRVTRFDTAKMNIRPCLGCDYCQHNDGACVHKDDMHKIVPEVFAADVIVLISPLYYFGMTAQLKAVIDRLYAPNEKLRTIKKRVLLIAAGADTEGWIMDAIAEHVRAICRYMRWDTGKMLLAPGLSKREDAQGSSYEQEARELGRSL